MVCIRLNAKPFKTENPTQIFDYCIYSLGRLFPGALLGQGPLLNKCLAGE